MNENSRSRTYNTYCMNVDNRNKRDVIVYFRTTTRYTHTIAVRKKNRKGEKWNGVTLMCSPLSSCRNEFVLIKMTT